MRVSEILALLPEAGPTVARYGLSCFSCEARDHETLEEGCRTHGFSEEDIDDLVSDLNELLVSRPPRPETLSVSKEAALRLREVLEAEGKAGWVLLVGVDEAGKFCLEFAEKTDGGHRIFRHDDVSGVRLAADASTLARIGGATVDFREGRFKLDLPEDAAAGCGCGKGKGECGC